MTGDVQGDALEDVREVAALWVVRRVVGRVVGALTVGVTLAALAGCSDQTVEPVTTDAWVTGGLPEYCAGYDAEDDEFWQLVHSSCQVAQDGDMAQADALRQVLAELDSDDIARFQRTLVRLNHELRRVSQVADEVCAPGLGLGRDLGTDYRTWIIAHGQLTYESVLDDPDRLRDLPDARSGCGLGEPFGAVAVELYLERTARPASDPGLPVL